MNLDYKVPQEIRDKIPDYFYYGLAGEWVSVYGAEETKWHLNLDEDRYYDSGSGSWFEIFYMTCRKLGMMWLWDYYCSLDSYVESDIFDGYIELQMHEKFFTKNREYVNCYYRHIVDLHRSDVNG